MRLLSALFLTLIIFSSCKEVPPNINFKPVDQTLLDTSYIDMNIPTVQEKHILVEEFTGIACIGCPGGHQKLEEILTSYGNRVEVISIHPKGIFTNPDFYPEFDADFTTDAGEDIITLYGPQGSLPLAGVDRVEFDDQGGSIYIESQSTWIVKVTERLSSTTPVNIEITETIYDAVDKYAKLKVKLHYTSSVVNNQYLSVYLLEDSIIAPQLNANFDATWVNDYVHKHILRDMFSSYQGDELSEDLELGRVFEKEFKLSIDDSWDHDKLHVVAAVHHKIDSNNVVNVRSAHIGH